MPHLETTLERQVREYLEMNPRTSTPRRTQDFGTTFSAPTAFKIPQITVADEPKSQRDPLWCFALVALFTLFMAMLGGLKSYIPFVVRFCFDLIFDSIFDLKHCIAELFSEPTDFAPNFGMYLICALLHLNFFQPPWSKLIFKVLLYVMDSASSNFAARLPPVHGRDPKSCSRSRNLTIDEPSHESKSAALSDQLNFQLIAYKTKNDHHNEKLNSANANTILSQERQINNQLQTIFGLEYQVTMLIAENHSYEQTLSKCLPTGLGLGLITHDTVGKTKAELLIIITDLKEKVKDEEHRHDRVERLLLRAKKDHKKELNEVRLRSITKHNPTTSSSTPSKRTTVAANTLEEKNIRLEKMIDELQGDNTRLGDTVMKSKKECKELTSDLEKRDIEIQELREEVAGIPVKDERISKLEEQAEESEKNIAELNEQIKSINAKDEKIEYLIGKNIDDSETIKKHLTTIEAHDAEIGILEQKSKVELKEKDEQHLEEINSKDAEINAFKKKVNRCEEDAKVALAAAVQEGLGLLGQKSEEITKLQTTIGRLTQDGRSIIENQNNSITRLETHNSSLKMEGTSIIQTGNASFAKLHSTITQLQNTNADLIAKHEKAVKISSEKYTAALQGKEKETVRKYNEEIIRIKREKDDRIGDLIYEKRQFQERIKLLEEGEEMKKKVVEISQDIKTIDMSNQCVALQAATPVIQPQQTQGSNEGDGPVLKKQKQLTAIAPRMPESKILRLYNLAVPNINTLIKQLRIHKCKFLKGEDGCQPEPVPFPFLSEERKKDEEFVKDRLSEIGDLLQWFAGNLCDKDWLYRGYRQEATYHYPPASEILKHEMRTALEIAKSCDELKVSEEWEHAHLCLAYLVPQI